jgi:hypothetical protein
MLVLWFGFGSSLGFGPNYRYVVPDEIELGGGEDESVLDIFAEDREPKKFLPVHYSTTLQRPVCHR